jgi:hypothetical protein
MSASLKMWLQPNYWLKIADLALDAVLLSARLMVVTRCGVLSAILPSLGVQDKRRLVWFIIHTFTSGRGG